jgi:DNA-binding PucR family transcriptional regulator
MGPELLKPILNYDHKHNTNYVETLESYLKHNGSIQAVAEEMFTHRNTIIYRVNNIKKLLDCTLDTAEERMRYQIACLILHM